MAATPEEATKEKATKNHQDTATAAAKPDSLVNKVDPRAPAGSKNSLGEESVRDGRPATKDDVVEAIDEEGPGIPTPPFNDTADN